MDPKIKNDASSVDTLKIEIARATKDAFIAAENGHYSDSIVSKESEEDEIEALRSSSRSGLFLSSQCESIESGRLSVTAEEEQESNRRALSESDRGPSNLSSLSALNDVGTECVQSILAIPKDDVTDVVHVHHDRSDQSNLPDSIEEILRSCGSITMPSDKLRELWNFSETAMLDAFRGFLVGEEFPRKQHFSSTSSPKLPHSYNALLLYSLFATAFEPPPSLEEVEDIYNLECEYLEQGMRQRNATLPKNSLIFVGTAQKSSIVKLLLSHRHFLTLPTPFQLSFLRILIRLLTNESDDEYERSCYQSCETKDDLSFQNSEEDHSYLSATSKAQRVNDKSDRAKKIGETPIPSRKAADLHRKTHERIKRMREKRESIDEQRKKQSWIAKRVDQPRNPKDTNQIYALVRFCCGEVWGRKRSLSAVLDLFDMARISHHNLLFPIVRLLGLICTTGVTVDELKRLIRVGSEPSDFDYVLDQYLVVKALTTAAEGCSESTFWVGKTNQKFFFTFGKQPKGICRTIQALPNWPFRNDFGMAVWFRSESISEEKPAKLVTVLSPCGAGTEVSIVSLKSDKAASVIVITVFDAGHANVERAIVKNCVLVPQVWYHLAVRHTRSRLKGVFSLSARQQVSVFLDGMLILTEPMKFPGIVCAEQDAKSKPKSFFPSLQLKTQQSQVRVEFGSNFEGQAGTLYLFNDNVSASTLRALYLATAGARSRIPSKDSVKDDALGTIMGAGKTVIDLNSHDADEIVMVEQQDKRQQVGSSSRAPSILDLCDDGDEQEVDMFPELSKLLLKSKLFLVWDPKRIEASVLLDLHSGAHTRINSENIQPWCVNGAKNVIASIGGIQALLTIFNTILMESKYQNEEQSSNARCIESLVPALLSMLAAFLCVHDENAREMVRCGGIDIIEQLLLQHRFSKEPRSNLVRILQSRTALGNLLVDALVELRLASEHYSALESTILSRLVFNFPLWFGSDISQPGISLYPTLLPALSSLTASHPEKVRDSVGIRQFIEILKMFTDVDESENVKAKSPNVSREPATELFDRSSTSGLSPDAPLTIQERRHVVDVILGMVATMLRFCAAPVHLSPLVNYISFNADYDWEEGSTASKTGENPIARCGTRLERHLSTVKATTILCVLLKSRPPVPNIHQGLNFCCGGSLGTVSWILCTLVNSFDDEMRSVGIRCFADYFDSIECKLDSNSVVDRIDDTAADTRELRVPKNASKLSRTFNSVGKSLTNVMGGSQVLSSALPTAKHFESDIVYKLLWHLLKCHRTRMGAKTHAALIYLVLEDRGSAYNVESLVKGIVVPDTIFHAGYKLCLKQNYCSLLTIENVTGKRLRQGPAINMILRLLKFLPDDWKEKWLLNFVKFTSICSVNKSIVVEGSDWQPALFHVVSDAVEEVDSTNRTRKAEGRDLKVTGSMTNRLDTTVDYTQRVAQDHLRVQARYNLSLKLYSILLGHCFRQGDEKSISALEQAASLERVCVNGQEVFCLILNHLLSELIDKGTIDSIISCNGSGEVVCLLKESARRVTEAILSKGSTGAAIDTTFALKQWHALRHLAAVTSCVIAKSNFHIGTSFQNHLVASGDPISGGIFGIRLPEAVVDVVSAADYTKLVATQTKGQIQFLEEERCRRFSVQIAAQTLSLLDAFIFPDSLDASLPVSQLHGLALVRSNETRLGTSQGPILAALIRLSLVLLYSLEPCSVRILQCCSRLRCFLHWALELIHESVALAGYSAAFHDLTAPLDRLILSIVLHCQRALGRCGALLSVLESPSRSKHFRDEDTRRRNEKRLLRVSFELREIVLTAYKGRNEVLRAALSFKSFEALQESLEYKAMADAFISKYGSRDVRCFLKSTWITSYQEIDAQDEFYAIEQASNRQKHETISSHRGHLAVKELITESSQMVIEFTNALDEAFNLYLEDQKNWAETDLVRDLEYEGDVAVKRLSLCYKNSVFDTSRSLTERARGAANRWDVVSRQVAELWTSHSSHWCFPKYTDGLGRRILLTRNRDFKDHEDASYELMLGLERVKAERERAERLEKQEEKERKNLLDVVKRNSAFVPYGPHIEEDEELDADESSESVAHLSAVKDREEVSTDGQNVVDKEQQFLKEEDTDSWAKCFVWVETEAVVARFEDVALVELRATTEGKLLLTTHGLYFNCTGNVINTITKSCSKADDTTLRWRLSRLTEAHGRRFMLCAQAIELFFADGVELFLNFSNGTRERDKFYAKLRNSSKTPLLYSPKSLNPRVVFKRSKIAQMWRRGKMSNFEYLMCLNKMAGRTFNDVTQYPVFPWVLSDYSSEDIDLNDPKVYRDLTKPVGALNEERLAALIERYNDLASFGFADNERFLYGSHYSSPGVVLHYLLRQEPFTSMAIELQSGRFDCPDRLFFDIAGCWNSCMTSTSDVKELVPELFTCPEVLLNTNGFPLGHTQNGLCISNVRLPPWAKGSAHEFIRIQRLALESEYVSRNLNHWIDLIFGYKQRGPEAESSHNIFHYLSYEGAIDMEKITDEVERQAAESHIQNFGQTPSQLLTKEPHPCKTLSRRRFCPVIHNATERQYLNFRCYTPPKQFCPRLAKGSVVSILPVSDILVAVYSDMSVGMYKVLPSSRNGRNPTELKMERHRTLNRSGLSMSRRAIKRGSAAPTSMECSSNPHSVGNWSFAVLGATLQDTNRRRARNVRLTSSTELKKDTEASVFLLSCGYWDDTVKCHSLESLKPISSDSGGHQGPIRCLSLGSGDSLLVTGGQDATLRVWVVDHPDMALALCDSYVQTSLGVSNNGDNFLTLCHILWGHCHAISCLDLSSSLDVVVSGDLGGLICIHTLRCGVFVRSFQPIVADSGNVVLKIALNDHGTFVVHMEDRSLQVYTVNGVHLCTANADDILHAIKICYHGEMLVTGGEKGHVVVRAIRDLAIYSTVDISKHGPIRCISLPVNELNDTQQSFYVGSYDGFITILSEDPEDTTKPLL
mmetsp:Transcript_3651/g.5568  ORF Transcript_3651/g.5568 Transcript_3651/m.5568 type:complete len:2959 (-) Transcript_3651:158-9034(-)